ncbi:MAG: T9SS C-terminal target domain-containing protein, partial [Chitinophagia bacterium]|nr:T9SS C-terminal target domain-containing protein [Chitinophagia bacterium]
ADGYNHSVRKVDASGTITTIGGNYGFTGDGSPATAATLQLPVDMAYNYSEGIVIADQGAHRIRLVDASGMITTLAGKDTAGNTGDGGLAADATLTNPMGVAVDRAGNTYIADMGANCVRRIDRVTGIITRYAGTGVPGAAGDGSLAVSAQLNGPVGIAFDKGGNLYISDSRNNTIRRVDSVTGIITLYAGNGTAAFSGDNGPANIASLNAPMYIGFDKSNNLFIADMNNNRVRMVDGTTGVISTVFGNGTRGSAGDGGTGIAAELCSPVGVTVDSFGGVTVTTCGKIRHLPGGGRPPIRLEAGSSLMGMTPNGTAAPAVAFRSLANVTYDRNYSLLIADQGSRAVLTSTTPFGVGVKEVVRATAAAEIYPNPNQGVFRITTSAGSLQPGEELVATIYDVLGRQVYSGSMLTGNSAASLQVSLGSQLVPGVYVCQIAGGATVTSVRFVIER